MPFKCSVFEASKLVSTKTLLPKYCYRRQGFLGQRLYQGAAKGGRQKESDHFFSSLGPFWSPFGHFV